MALLGIAAATAVWVVVVRAWSGLGRAQWSRGARRGAIGAGALAAVLFPAAFFGYPAVATDGAQYRARACFRSTPGLAILCAALQPPAPRVTMLDLQPVVPMSAYLATVDPRRLQRPNVLLVVVESQRRDSLRALGGTRPVMPYLDVLAEQGLLFTNAYAQSNATDYSVPSILSSLYPLRHREQNVFDDLRYPRTLIHDVLKAVGYRTGVFSSSNDRWGNVVGFYTTPSLDVVFYPEVYEGETVMAPQDTGFMHRVKEGIFQKGTLDDAVTVDRFLSWVREGPADRPFFAFLNLQTAHFPYQMAFSIDTPFEPSTLDFDASFGSYPYEKRHVMRNRYDNSLRRVDGELRRAMEELEALGQGDRTVLVVVGDHGQEFFEHGRVTHGQLMHQEVLQVPLLLGPARLPAAPELPGGGRAGGGGRRLRPEAVRGHAAPLPPERARMARPQVRDGLAGRRRVLRPRRRSRRNEKPAVHAPGGRRRVPPDRGALVPRAARVLRRPAQLRLLSARVLIRDLPHLEVREGEAPHEAVFLSQPGGGAGGQEDETRAHLADVFRAP